MSRTYTKEDTKNINVMDSFFRGRIALEPEEHVIAEIGDGVGIGRNGTYSTYVKRLSSLSKQNIQNPSIYIGKNIVVNEDSNTVSVDEVQDDIFDIEKGEIPIVLVMLYNVINETQISVAWEDLDRNIISHSMYNIPAPLASGYTWWDMYGAYFYSPENLGAGNYYAAIKLIENRPLADPTSELTQVVSDDGIYFSLK